MIPNSIILLSCSKSHLGRQKINPTEPEPPLFPLPCFHQLSGCVPEVVIQDLQQQVDDIIQQVPPPLPPPPGNLRAFGAGWVRKEANMLLRGGGYFTPGLFKTKVVFENYRFPAQNATRKMSLKARVISPAPTFPRVA